MRRFMKVLFISLVVLIFSSCHKNQNRVQPDISIYDTITLDTVQTKLSKVIAETSGLALIDSTFWTHNDSGGEPALYEFDPYSCLLYTSPSPRDLSTSRMPSSA